MPWSHGGGASGGAPLPDDPSRQKAWDLSIVERNWENMLRVADQVSRARLLATAQRESGAWLNALPVSTLGTLLDSESFRVAIALRVGADVCIPHSCRCGGRMDSRGLHGLSCRTVLAAFQDIRQWMMWLRERFKKPACHQFWSLLG